MRIELLRWWMLPCALAGMLLGAAHLAGAQEVPDGQGRDRPDPSKIEEITITAEKRETLLQNTPVAVSAFTDEMLQRAGINDIEQLSFLVPNLHFGESLGVANITIRGVGTLGGDQATSFHIDGNYQNNPIIPGGLTFFDVERIEVLRGPQGTLYGRNSTAGAVNVLSRRPSNRFEAFGDIQVGSFNQIFSRGALNFPIVDDRVMARVSFYQERRNGYTRNLATPSRKNDPNDVDTWAMRGQLRLTPTDDIDLVLRAVYSQAGGVGPADKKLGPFPEIVLSAGIPFETFREATPNPEDNREIYLDTIGQVSAEVWGVSMTFDWDFELPLLGDVAFKINASYQEQDFGAILDFDNSDAWVVVTDIELDDFEGVGDIHLGSASEGVDFDIGGQRFTLDWLFGVFGLVAENSLHVLAPARLPIDLPPGHLDISDTEIFSRDNADSIGIYTQESIGFMEDWSLILGLRWNHDRKRGIEMDSQIVLPPPFPPICVADGIDSRKKDHWSRFTGRIGLDYQPTPNHLVYAKFDPGYKAGTIEHEVPLLPESILDGCTTAKIDNTEPERIYAFEAGSKNTFFDQRLRANLTGFYYDYEDLQVAQLVGQSFVTQNAAQARTYGIELELVGLPVDDLLLALNFSYLNARFGEFLGFLAENPPPGLGDGQTCQTNPEIENCLDFSGNPMLRAPRFTTSITAQYDLDMGRFGSLIPYVQLFVSDEVFFRPGSEEQLREAQEAQAAAAGNTLPLTFFDDGRQDPYALLNLRVTWRSANDNFYVEGFVNNVTDEDVINNKTVGTILLGTPITTSFDPPRTWGLRFGFSW